MKAWLLVSSQPTNIMQRNAFRGHSTKYKFARAQPILVNYNLVENGGGAVQYLHS